MAITQEKADRIAEEYAKIGYKDKTTPLLACGYKKSYACSIGHKLYRNVKVIEAIAKIRAKAEQIFEHNYEKAIEMLEKRLEWLDKKAEEGNVQAIQAQTAIIREMDSISGLNIQNIHTTSEQQRELSEREAEEAKRLASIRLRQGA